ETISGFDNLVSVGGWFSISGNDSLSNLSEFISLKEVGLSISTEGNFIIEDNDALLIIKGFNTLETIGWDLSIGSNSLTTIQGFSNLKKVTRFFNISGYLAASSPNLVSIPLFDTLEIIGGGFNMVNSGLTQLSGFNNIQVIGGGFTITSNDNLVSINGFTNLDHIYGGVEIVTNNSLESIIGFNQLATVGYFQINLNPSLTSLAGLESLIKVADISFINDYSFFITDNISLTDCSAICNLLSNNGITGLIEIVGNPPSCSSQSEIEQY